MLQADILVKNRYRIVRMAGEGGMGAVYEALDESLNTTVALKQTYASSEEIDKAFRREARLLAGLRHPALPRVIDYFQDDYGQFLVMEFIPGPDLSQRQRQEGIAFPVKQVVRWLDQLLDALTYLHSQNPPVIHRDIKPQNLKLTSEDNIVLLDFGLAKGAMPQEDTTQARSVYGYTPLYAPMEQIRGTGTDARSDLFALAATAYRLLTNVAPIAVLERATTIVEGGTDPLQPIYHINPRVPIAVSDICMRALSLKLEERNTSAAAMRRELAAAIEGEELSDTAIVPAASAQHAAYQQNGHPNPTIVLAPEAEVSSPTSQITYHSQTASTPRKTTHFSDLPLLMIGVGSLVVVVVLASLLALSNLFGSGQVTSTGPQATPVVAATATSEPEMLASSATQPPATLEPTATPQPTASATPTSVPTNEVITAFNFSNPLLNFGGSGTGAGLFENARMVTVGSDGEIVVLDEATNQIQRFSASGVYLTSWPVEGTNPIRDITTDQQGHIYVVRDGKIWQYRQENGDLLAIFSDDRFSYSSLAMLPDDGFAATSYTTSDALVFLDAQGEVVEVVSDIISTHTGTSERDMRVVADSQGMLFVLGRLNGKVFTFDRDGTLQGSFGPGRALTVTGIAIDARDRIYLTFNQDPYIQIFDIAGRLLGVIGSEDGIQTSPRDLAFDTQGHLIVLTGEQTVMKLTHN